MLWKIEVSFILLLLLFSFIWFFFVGTQRNDSRALTHCFDLHNFNSWYVILKSTPDDNHKRPQFDWKSSVCRSVMFIPIRRGLRTLDIFLAITIGVGVSLYTWTPVIREKTAKDKNIQSAENSQQQSDESTKPTENHWNTIQNQRTKAKDVIFCFKRKFK